MASYRHVSSPVCNFNLTEFKNNTLIYSIIYLIEVLFLNNKNGPLNVAAVASKIPGEISRQITVNEN